MTVDPWETRSGVRETLRDRARKRTLEYLGYEDRYRWLIHGSEKLGDTYDQYIVTLVDRDFKDPNSYRCDCQSHRGGEYRKRCSHVVRVLIWGEEEGGWDEIEWAERGVAQVEPEPPTHTERENEPYDKCLFCHRALTDNAISTRLGYGPDCAHHRDLPYGVDVEKEDVPKWVYEPKPTYVDVPQPSVIERIGDRELTPQLVSELTPKYHPLPDKFEEFRESQEQAILECIEAFEDGKKVVFLSAPTGAGKSVLGEAVARFFGQRAYTCTTKSLQAQVLRDFTYARLMMGRSNYPTLDDPNVTADACTKQHSTATCWTCGKDGGKGHCDFCHPTNHCPYSQAKRDAAAAGLAVLNTAYLLREATSPRSAFTNRDLYIMDEADRLEKELMSFVEVVIGPRLRKRLNVGLPDLKGNEESWVTWISSVMLPAAEAHLSNLTSGLFSTMGVDPHKMREVKSAEGLVEKLQWLMEPIDEDGEANLSNGWVMDVQNQRSRWKKGGGDDNQNVTLVFKPIKVDRFAREALWSMGNRWLLMSATFVSPSQEAENLGLERDEWTVIEVESSFPIERRPIVPKSVARVVGKSGTPERKQALEQIVDATDVILANHPHDRILIHTVSYEIANLLRNSLHDYRRIHSYDNANEREKALAKFLGDPRGVMLAPSFERGIDLAGDDCRVIVIPKVPYPYLGDAQIAARAKGTGSSGRRWYIQQTIKSLCQMTGRAMRSEDDWCISYVLDAAFSKLYQENRAMFPTWWKDAIVWDKNEPKWRRALADIYSRFGEEVEEVDAMVDDPLDGVEVF